MPQITASMRKRVTTAGGWNSAGSILEQVLRLVSNMILARLIAPEMLAQVAIVFSIIMLIEAFTDMGIKEAIIQSEYGNSPEFLNGAFLFFAARGVIIYLCGFVAAPIFAQFYNSPALIPLIRIAFLGVIFYSFINIGLYKGFKGLDFKRTTAVESGGRFLGLMLTILLALIFRNVYAIIIGMVSENFFRLTLSYVFTRSKIGFTVKKEYLQSLFSYSRKMFGLPLLTTLVMRLDVIVLGKMAAADTVGLYSMAVVLARAPINLLIKLMNPITLPYFSAVQNDKSRLSNGLSKVTAIIFLFTLPATIFVAFFSRQLISFVYTEQYATMDQALFVLFTAYVIRILNIPVASLFLSIGEPDKHRNFTVLRLLLLGATIFPLIALLGYMGAAYSFFLANLIVYIIELVYLKRQTDITITGIGYDLLLSLIYSIPILLFGIATRIYTSMNVTPLILIATGATLVSYLFVALRVYKKYISDKDSNSCKTGTIP